MPTLTSLCITRKLECVVEVYTIASVGYWLRSVFHKVCLVLCRHALFSGNGISGRLILSSFCHGMTESVKV